MALSAPGSPGACGFPFELGGPPLVALGEYADAVAAGCITVAYQLGTDGVTSGG